jgi:hypothetical protein
MTRTVTRWPHVEGEMGMLTERDKCLLRTATGGGQAVGAEPYPGKTGSRRVYPMFTGFQTFPIHKSVAVPSVACYPGPSLAPCSSRGRLRVDC